MSFILLIIGFVLLIKGADILIDSSAKLAHLLSIPPFIIGFSVIAFGTSAPELAVGIFSGMSHTNLITLGDVIGSCIANIALIIGITALINTLDVDKSVLYKDIPISLGVQLILTALLLLDGGLSRIDSLVLLVLFIVFLFYIFKRSREMVLSFAERGYHGEGMQAATKEKTIEASEKEGAEEAEEAEEIIEAVMEIDESKLTDVVEVKEHSGLKLAGLIFISLIAIISGGNLIVNSSTEIARMLGLSKVLIGLTVVAIGTSLPELVTSVVAALKKQSDIAIGNIIGSNIFNVLFVLGVSSLIHPIPAPEGIKLDIIIMLLSTCLIFIIPLRKKKIPKTGGIILLTFYAVFMVYKVFTA